VEFKAYRSRQRVIAAKMTCQQYHDHQKWDVPFGTDPAAKGFMVRYSESDSTWFAKDEFNLQYAKA